MSIVPDTMEFPSDPGMVVWRSTGIGHVGCVLLGVRTASRILFNTLLLLVCVEVSTPKAFGGFELAAGMRVTVQLMDTLVQFEVTGCGAQSGDVGNSDASSAPPLPLDNVPENFPFATAYSAGPGRGGAGEQRVPSGGESSTTLGIACTAWKLSDPGLESWMGWAGRLILPSEPISDVFRPPPFGSQNG